MSDWYTWVFSGIGVAISSALISYIRAKSVFFTGVRFLDRSEIDRAIGTVQQRFENVQGCAYISGNDGKFVVESQSPYLEALLKRGKRVEVLLVDPKSNVPEMLAMIDPRFQSPEVFRASMGTVLEFLAQWKIKYPNNFDYRLLPFLPAMGFFITDPELDKGIVKIEMYTASPWQPIDSRPHLIVSSRAGKWRSYFTNQWKNYWARGTSPNPSINTAQAIKPLVPVMSNVRLPRN